MCLADPIAHVRVGARVCDVFAIYEQPRTSARGVRGKDVRLLTRVRDTRARARLSARSSLSVPRTQTRTRTWIPRGEEVAEGKSFGQRSLDNRAPSYRRISPHRGKATGEKVREARERGDRGGG